ncbi:hypothetical protein LUCX_112 [Xanthomonas phage vB_XciM_LucasX]|nr:hypothetical protein LUCX_112 [Xanthomonas phage vB_XciM_LucasX]
MSARLANAIKLASEDALATVSLESIEHNLAESTVSLEQHLEDLEGLQLVAAGLESVVVSFESIDSPSAQQFETHRTQAATYLQLSGLSAEEARSVLPSMEAAGSGWESFKAFLVRLWEMVKAALTKTLTLIMQLLRRSTTGEKVAMGRLRLAQTAMAKLSASLTIKPVVTLNQTHRYLCSETQIPKTLQEVMGNLRTYKTNRDLVLREMPNVMAKVVDDLTHALDRLALGGTVEQVSASVVAVGPDMLKALEPLRPGPMGQKLGVVNGHLSLAYDRAVEVAGVENGDEVNLSSLGVRVTQLTLDMPEIDGQDFPALRVAELKELHRMAVDLIDTASQAEAQLARVVNKVSIKARGLDFDAIIKSVLRKEGLSVEAQTVLKQVLHLRQAMPRWVVIPAAQICSINILVVNAIISMINTQVENYQDPNQ